MYKVQKNYPLPRRGNNVRDIGRFPLDKMEIGDSFLIPREEYSNTAVAKSCLHSYAKRRGCKIRLAERTMEYDDEDGYRVWLVERGKNK